MISASYLGYDDDFNCDSEKKKNWERWRCFLVSSNETVACNYKQSNSQFVISLYKCCYNFDFKCVCARTSNSREVFLLLIFSTVIYLFCAPPLGLLISYSYRYTASGYVNFTVWV